MPAADPAAKPGLLARALTVLVGGLFALSFGGVGLYMGLLPIVHNLAQAWQVRTWQPAPATVISTSLDSSRGSKGSTSHTVRAEYEYTFAGTTHRAHRVGLDTWLQADNVGSWHSDWHRRLQQAQSGNAQLTAWVNPARPDQALLDRSIRWTLMLFRLPFAVLFTAVGAAAAWKVLAALLGRPSPSPWPRGRTRAGQGAAPRASTGALKPVGTGGGFLWVFAGFWLLISVPLAVGMWPKGFMPFAGGLLFVAIGLLVAGWAWRETLRGRRYGGLRLVMQPAQPRTGDALQLQLQLPARAQAALQRQPAAQLHLAMNLVDESCSSSTSTCLWSQGVDLRGQGGANGLQSTAAGGLQYINAHFDLPPDGLPTGAVRRNERVQWRLTLKDASQRELSSFDLTVQQGPQAASLAHWNKRDWGKEQAIDAAQLATQPAPAWPPDVQVQEGEFGWRLVMARRWWRHMAGVLAIGLVALLWPWVWQSLWPWLGPAWQAVAGDAGMPLAPAAGPTGLRRWGAVVLAWLVLHLISLRSTLTVQHAGLQVDRSSWLVPRRQQLSFGQVQGLFHKLAFVQSTGTRSTEYHALWAKTGPRSAARLSPALPTATVQALAWHVNEAMAHHRGRSAPGLVRQGDGGPLLRWLAFALAWAGWCWFAVQLGA